MYDYIHVILKLFILHILVYKDFWEQNFTFDFRVENRACMLLRNAGTYQFTRRHNPEVHNRNILYSDNTQISASAVLVCSLF